MASNFHQLQGAIKRSDIVAVREFLSSGGDPNLADSDGTSLLMVAASRGHGPLVELLLASGADPNATSAGGHHPLLHASVPGCHVRVVRLLLEHGADPAIPAAGQSLSAWLSRYGERGAAVLAAIAKFEEGAA